LLFGEFISCLRRANLFADDGECITVIVIVLMMVLVLTVVVVVVTADAKQTKGMFAVPYICCLVNLYVTAAVWQEDSSADGKGASGCYFCGGGGGARLWRVAFINADI
jgi:hypothetical protein